MPLISPDLLFVYGSLRRNNDNPMARMLANSADYIGVAAVQGILYQIDWYPGLVRSVEPGKRVRGDLYKMHAPCQLLALLDEYEECAKGFPHPQEYRREVASVQQDARTIQAWIYYYNRPIRPEFRVIGS